MYMKILGLYKGLKDSNKKGIPGHIILCLSITYIFLFLGIIIGALGYENIMLCAYAFFTICTFITCILSYRLVNNCFENNTKDYNDNVLDPFENKLRELKIGNNKSIERLIEQCKEYEMVEKDAGLKNFKYILGIAIIPLITSAGTLIISKMDDEEKVNDLAKRIVTEDMSVRDLERLSQDVKSDVIVKGTSSSKKGFDHKYRMYENIIMDSLDTKVRVSKKKIEIYFDGVEELEEILSKMNVKVEEE